MFVCCSLAEERNHCVGLPETFVSNILTNCYLNHTAVLPPIFHHIHPPVFSHLLKLLSRSFSTLVSLATFPPDHASGPLVIFKSTRGSKRILITQRSKGPERFYSLMITMNLPLSVYLLILDG